MKRRLLLLFVFVALLLPATAQAFTQVHFSPGVRPHILAQLDRARETVDLAMFSFTDSDLAWALVRAHERGVRVRVCLDADQAEGKYSKSRFLLNRGLPVRHYWSAGCLHHKFAVIDRRVVITGSYNWTASAEERNRENVLILEDPVVAMLYGMEFEGLWVAAYRPPEAPLETSTAPPDPPTGR